MIKQAFAPRLAHTIVSGAFCVYNCTDEQIFVQDCAFTARRINVEWKLEKAPPLPVIRPRNMAFATHTASDCTRCPVNTLNARARLIAACDDSLNEETFKERLGLISTPTICEIEYSFAYLCEHSNM